MPEKSNLSEAQKDEITLRYGGDFLEERDGKSEQDPSGGSTHKVKLYQVSGGTHEGLITWNASVTNDLAKNTCETPESKLFTVEALLQVKVRGK